MPMNRALYPANWSEIASAIKEAAEWTCQGCGATCYRPGEKVESRTRVLTVHHRDGNPGNCDPDNLVALCAPCHLRADATLHAQRASHTRAVKAARGMAPIIEVD